MTNDLLHYFSYRDFLKNYYQQRKENNPSWSYAVWAKKLKLKEASFLTKVVGGSRHLNSELASVLAEYFHFNALETSYWKYLIDVERINLQDQSREKLLTSLKNQLLSATNKAADISILPQGIQWIHGMILVLINDYQDINLQNISEYLKIPIKNEELSLAISELMDAHIISLDQLSNFKLTTSIHSVYADNTDSSHYQKNQVTTCQSFLQAAQTAMFTDETPVGGYLSQNMFLSIDPKDIGDFTNELREAAVEVMLKYEKKSGPKALYNLLLQGYEVTKVVEN